MDRMLIEVEQEKEKKLMAKQIKKEKEMKVWTENERQMVGKMLGRQIERQNDA